MKRIIPAILVVTLSTSCQFSPKNFTPAWPKPHSAAKPKLNGYGPIKFGMKRIEAAAALGQMGQEIVYDEALKPAYFFKDYQGGHEFDAWVYFDKKADTVNKVELTSVNALNAAKTGADCLYYFRQFQATFVSSYGDVDQPVRYHDDGVEARATAFFTASDSSSVRVSYKFNKPKSECRMNITYVAAWAS